MKGRSGLRAGDFVEVRSKTEILTTLDEHARLDGLPFMPQMFQYCGKRFRVFKRAHKTCDTVFPIRSRRLAEAVHLEIRCDGEAYGGCDAGCLIFWKEAWLRKISDSDAAGLCDGAAAVEKAEMHRSECTEPMVWAGTRRSEPQPTAEVRYICQATQLPYFTSDLKWWDIRQYAEDYTSGNVTLWTLVKGLCFSTYFNVSNAGIGLGPVLRFLYDAFSRVCGSTPFPRKNGVIPKGQPTPHCALGFKPGDLVRVKSHREILATLDTENKNRGLYYDAEAVPYSGGTYQVLKRVTKILDEKTGKLIRMKNDAVILDGVYCQSKYSTCRMFCPRGIYSYWREIWLERVPQRAEDPERSRFHPDQSCDPLSMPSMPNRAGVPKRPAPCSMHSAPALGGLAASGCTPNAQVNAYRRENT